LGVRTPEMYNNLAVACKNAGQFEGALAALDQAVALRADYANGHFNRGNLLVRMGRLPEALVSLRQAVRYNPQDAGAQCILGMGHVELGQLPEALECFDRALEIQPDYPEARRNRGF